MDARADDDAIDLHDLQAQIDLSMSFAQNLVTSWVKPTHYAQTSRQRDLEDEIKEFMRRPARLGVGAPTPETRSLAREAARLKSKLGAGKKRSREDESVDVKTSQSDDEEESRTGAIKNKARVDPFGALSKKHRKDTGDNGKAKSAMHPTTMEATPRNQPSLAEDGVEADEIAKELLAIPATPENRKIKHNLLADHCHNREKQAETVLLPDVKITPPTSELLTTSGLSILPQPFTQDASKLPTLPSTVPSVSRRNLASVSLTPDPTLPFGGHTADASFLQPLLNLRGSPSEPESENDLLGPSGLMPKKKRKRRKKKKSQQSTETLPFKT